MTYIMQINSGEDPAPVFFDLMDLDPVLFWSDPDPTPSYLFIRKTTHIASK